MIEFSYTNYKGKTAVRNIVPTGIRFGASEFHKETQWLIRGFCTDRKQYREFAMKDMTDVVMENSGLFELNDINTKEEVDKLRRQLGH